MAIKWFLYKFLVKIGKMNQLILISSKYFTFLGKIYKNCLLLMSGRSSVIHFTYKIFYSIFFGFLILMPLSCEKVQDTPVPNVPVDFVINLNIVNELTVSCNSVFFPRYGYGGVIVYCERPGSYYAFDAACTYEVSRSCVVKNEGVLATCPCCGSQFVLLGSAYPSEGPATMPLKQYHVSIINNFEIRVYN